MSYAIPILAIAVAAIYAHAKLSAEERSYVESLIAYLVYFCLGAFAFYSLLIFAIRPGAPSRIELISMSFHVAGLLLSPVLIISEFFQSRSIKRAREANARIQQSLDALKSLDRRPAGELHRRI